MNTTSSIWRIALHGAALGVLLAGCPPVKPGTDSGVIDAGCAGAIGCECAGGSCNSGECVGGTCVDCRRGELDCICRSNNTCNTGLRCSTSTKCETCPAGEQGCACGTGDTCGTGLLCMNGSCVVDTCVAGTAGCPCRTGASACDSTLYCDGTSLCQACSNDVIGCPCVGAACAGETVCDTGTQLCRAAVTCAQLIAGGGCLPNQACAEGNGTDAQCVPGTCQPEFKWTGSACVACVSPGCANEPSCDDHDGGLGSTCDAQNRVCTNGMCGACMSGFAQNGAGACVPAPTCGATTCSLNQYCDRTSGTPTCTTNPCPTGQAMNTAGTCTACAPTCTATGFSGRVWPFMNASDQCLCETLDNYFIFPGGFVTATRCDADGDGWVREEAGDPSVQGAPPYKANEHCNIQKVDRVRLFDEYGISVDVLSCNEGMLKASDALPDGGARNGGFVLAADGGIAPLPDGGIACTGIKPLPLLETARNDVPGSPSGIRAPEYGGTTNGRLLEAAELNSLTKGCVSTNADYNDNKLDDIAEIQGQVALIGRPDPSTERKRLESFSFFLELASATLENGVLAIRERSRCEALFPFHYDADAGTNDQYTLSNDKPYWRTCSRNRDPDYTANTPTAGFDFAQFGCDATLNTCPLVPPPHPIFIAPVSPATTLFRDFGLCRMGGALPADGLWRGLNHHSQFKCVNVRNTTMDTFDRPVAAFGQTNGLLTLNKCVARPCTTPGDSNCSTPQGLGAQTREPVLDCTAQQSATTGDVGFAAVNYRPYRFVSSTSYAGNDYSVFTYQGGCVNEDDAWWDFLCPYPEFLLNRARADANYGRYSCFKYASNFVWGGPANANNRATLRWGGNTNSAVLGPRPPPDGGL